MKLSVLWGSLMTGVGCAVFAAARCAGTQPHGDESQQHNMTVVFFVALAIFLWPVFHDLVKILLWTPEAKPQSKRLPRLPQASRMIERRALAAVMLGGVFSRKEINLCVVE